jgi:hypothetical protein
MLRGSPHLGLELAATHIHDSIHALLQARGDLRGGDSLPGQVVKRRSLVLMVEVVVLIWRGLLVSKIPC